MARFFHKIVVYYPGKNGHRPVGACQVAAFKKIQEVSYE